MPWCVMGRRCFQSPLMREDSAAIPVSIDLRGATSFVLRVDDGGDGISCDQADWAEAQVRLVGGGRVTAWGYGDLRRGGKRSR
ncbi:MAG: NPCBM/NEW2 domain-containing protein [Verrucomicrobiota bacterium]